MLVPIDTSGFVDGYHLWANETPAIQLHITDKYGVLVPYELPIARITPLLFNILVDQTALMRANTY